MVAMEVFFRLWFFASALALTLFAGWTLARFGLHLLSIFFFCVVLILWIPSMQKSKRKYQKKKVLKWGKMLREIAKSTFIILTFLLGIFLGRANIFSVNEWIENSFVILKNETFPVKFFTAQSSAFVPSDSEKKQFQSRLSGLEVYQNNINKKILISFNKSGLTLLSGQRATLLLGEKGLFLGSLSQLPDGSFVYYQHRNGLSLTRSIVRNEVLYKIWERKLPGMYIHHWGDAFENNIYLPGRNFIDLPNDISRSMGNFYRQCVLHNAVSDTIYIFSASDGSLRKTIDLLPILASVEAKDRNLLHKVSNCRDPLHLNDIQLIQTEKHALFFPGGKIGDILISLRNINTMMLIDKDTHQLKWHISDKFKMQHSPRITDQGTIIIFDNQGSARANGVSRIVELDIASRNIVGKWEASGGDFFESIGRGKITLLGDTRLMVQDQYSRAAQNAIFVLDCPSFPISMACKKEMVFSGKAPDFLFDNAILLYEEE